MENISNNQQLPPEVKKWNWGAFMLNIFWGIGNNSYLPLLCLIPFFNIIWMFVCGAKGNQWAWNKGNYSSAEEFLLVQKTWNKAGLAYFIFTVVIILLYIFIFSTLIARMLTMNY
ncbi:ribonuclease G [Clostridium taeniosporum]|uniref:Ribonuclease G n=1 Tax=Clostridium taeniosporum TaxID=394958 RepID=A0A1D7XGZ2_9CLOT|nr:ribonuclease G [Clostridium taeniosporum]AOR22624.1 ribonuclease G [Clostridium taeniosporum]